MRRLMVAIVILVVAGAAVVAIAALLRGEPPTPVVLDRPAAGQAVAAYLPDGTPIWLIGHPDGSVSALSAFDTHTPFNLGKLTWWCRPARAIDNPHHGSKWDEYGVKLGGPAPAALASWAVTTGGGQVTLGATRPAPPLGTPNSGPPEHERTWCFGPDADVDFHTFDGWQRWNSPTAAVAAAPEGWILLQGQLVADRASDEVRLCAPENCDDSALASNVDLPPADMDPGLGPLGGGEFIAQVRDGALVGVTRVVAP
jgi:hypothetical protein